jgi:hypothetical protein
VHIQAGLHHFQEGSTAREQWYLKVHETTMQVPLKCLLAARQSFMAMQTSQAGLQSTALVIIPMAGSMLEVHKMTRQAQSECWRLL